MLNNKLVLRKQLKSILDQRGLTAAELSRRTGISKQVLSDWLAGAKPRNLEQVYLLARTLGVSLEQLCFGDIKADVQARDLNEIRGVFEGTIKIIRRQ